VLAWAEICGDPVGDAADKPWTNVRPVRRQILAARYQRVRAPTAAATSGGHGRWFLV
jgi:hypothetical protein